MTAARIACHDTAREARRHPPRHCITGDAPRNVEFYAGTLGLRIVKKTVNQDDPTVYHLFYADERGSAGADITFFEYPGVAARARRRRDGAPHLVPRRHARSRSSSGRTRVGGTRDDGVAACSTTRRASSSSCVVDDGGDAPLIAHASGDPRGARDSWLRRRACVRVEPRALGVVPRAARPSRARTIAGSRAATATASTPTTHRPDGRRGVPGAGTVHHVAWSVAARRARGLGAEGRRGRCAAHAGDRPVLVPLDLLPRAERRALRDRHARAGLHRRRAARAPRREAVLPPASSTCAPRSSLR